MKKLLLLVLLIVIQTTVAQKTCATKSKLVQIDVNSLNLSKCDVVRKETKKKDKKIPVNYVTKRYLKKRKQNRQEVSSINTRQIPQLISSPIKDYKPKELTLVKSKIASIVKNIGKETISFENVEKMPQFYSCYDAGYVASSCFNYEMKKHIQQNYDYTKSYNEQGELIISFIINKEGNVSDIEIKGSKTMRKTKLEMERILKMLTKFLPGKNKGIPVNVFYSFPMKFD